MIFVRPLTSLEEFSECVQLQRLIWGWGDLDLLPVRFFVVARDIGGQVLGAFNDQFLCGFCLAIPGMRADRSVYLHSHMLGVLPAFRNAGAGILLKRAQRDDALARGIGYIEWTFDPLDLKNAYFNIVKLGATVCRYLPNHYGITSSALQGGLPTDRCVAEWRLADARATMPTVARVPVPVEIEELKRSDPRRARDIQKEVANLFAQHLSAGLAVTGFERADEVCRYLFSPWPSD